MAAYLLKRLLLIIPTLFGIMLISFIIIQFAPGGPVERIIAQLTGRDSTIASRIGGGGNDTLSSGEPIAARARRRRRRHVEVSRRAGPRSGVHQEPRKAVRLRQAGLRALLHHDEELPHLRLRQELFPRRLGAAADQGEAARLHIARAVDDADLLSHLHPARHPQGGAGRRAVRQVDEQRAGRSPTRCPASCSPCCC